MNPWYLFRHTFNCKLPDSYHYFDERGVEWSTTDCYLKGEAIRQLLSIILFIFYILILVGETIWWTSNVRKELFIYFIPSFSGLHLEFDPDLTWIRSKFDPDSIQIWPISVQIWPDKMCMPSKWKKCYRLIQYLPIESASNFIRDNSVSDLHLILAMVELNGCRQKVKTISSKKVIIYTWYVRRKFDLNKHRFVEVNVEIRVRRTNKSAKLSQKAILQWF